MSQRRDMVHGPRDQLLKVASRDLIDQAGGGANAAKICESRQQRMSDCGLANTPDFLRLDEAARLEDVTVGQPGWPHVTRAMAKRQNCIVFELPASTICPSDFHQSIGGCSKETGEVIQLLCEALADGTVTSREVRRKRIVENIDEAIEQLLRLRSLALSAPDEESR